MTISETSGGGRPDTRAGKPGVLVISSHVVRGAVGNRAAVFALEALGHRVWAMPTIVLPWHPGHGRSTRIAMPDETFAAALIDLKRTPKRAELGAVLSGYFASASQVMAVRDLVLELKDADPALLYLCDPVVGDSGGLYVPAAVADAIAEHLLPIADIATPNRFELAHFVGRTLDTNHECAVAALALGPKSVLVTSAVAMMAQSTGNLWVTPERVTLCEHRLVDNPPNGLGDLLSALFLSRLMAGRSEEEALRLATSSVFEVLARTVKRAGDELDLPTEQASLSTPMAMVQMRALNHPAKPARMVARPTPMPGDE